MKRRDFLKTGTLIGTSTLVAAQATDATGTVAAGPAVISTWKFGAQANAKAMSVLAKGESALDAVQQGVMVVESDPAVTSVGFGGLPNAEGVVELDAAIMDGRDLACGAVAGLRNIENPIAVARKVMDSTPHVLLVGDGARQFAIEQGFQQRDLLTEESKTAWHAWRNENSKSDPTQNHDTIGMVAIDQRMNMAAACTTSGLAWKLPGRVGDSPLIGHGLYCDDSVGGAAATGMGEEVIKVCGSYQVVEFMRHGIHPQEAVERVLKRILDRDPTKPERWVGFVALRKDGEFGFASTNPGFQVAIATNAKSETLSAPTIRIAK